MSEIPQKAVQAAVEAERRVRCSHTLGSSCSECRVRATLEAALEVLTPSGMIRRLMPSAKWGNPEWPKVKDVLAEEGMVVVSVEDYRHVLERTEQWAMHRLDADDSILVARLRSALPERNDHA